MDRKIGNQLKCTSNLNPKNYEQEFDITKRENN